MNLLFATAFSAAVLQASLQAAELVEVSQSPDLMWNGVAISKTGRVFVAYPAMQGVRTIGVGEILGDGSVRPYPGGTWNSPDPATPAEKHFIGINAVVSDADDQLWVVDPAGGFGSSPQEGKAKLVQIDIASNEVKRVYPVSIDSLPKGGFINDARIASKHAFLTDSGLGAIVVLDLRSGSARRLLANDPRLKADPALKLTINGKPYLNARGETPKMHVNTMDISPDGKFLYFQPNGGPRLLRLPVEKLIDTRLDDAVLSSAIEDVGPTRFNAGMTFGPDGSLYYSDIEISGITRRKPDGTFETIVSDPSRITWPDASRLSPDGFLYFPAAQVNRTAGNSPDGKSQIEKPFRLFKVKIP